LEEVPLSSRPAYISGSEKPVKRKRFWFNGVPVTVNDHSTGTMTMPSEFNIAKSKVYYPAFPFSFRCFLYLYRKTNIPKSIPVGQAKS
jgi:hypothetical protein